jgi:hypothetical protein
VNTLPRYLGQRRARRARHSRPPITFPRYDPVYVIAWLTILAGAAWFTVLMVQWSLR